MNELIQELVNVKNQIADIKSEHLKPLESRKQALEQEITEMLDTLGVDQTALRGVATVGINEKVVPQAEDWDQVYRYIQETGNFFLLNRALNAAAYRELVESEGDVPGLKPFVRRTLSVRTAS